MGMSELLRDPEAFAKSMKEFASSKENVEGGLGHMSYVQGLLTAAIVAPEFIPISEWMPRVADMSAESDAEDVQLLTSLVMLQYSEIVESLSTKKGKYEPLFWKDSDGRQITQDWAEGFVEGARLGDGKLSEFLQGEGKKYGAVIGILAQREGLGEILAELGLDLEETLKEARRAAPEAVQSMYDCWSGEKTAKRPFPETAPRKIGRNDPCPCGSGKKYKKCCLS